MQGWLFFISLFKFFFFFLHLTTQVQKPQLDAIATETSLTLSFYLFLKCSLLGAHSSYFNITPLSCSLIMNLSPNASQSLWNNDI